MSLELVESGDGVIERPSVAAAIAPAIARPCGSPVAASLRHNSAWMLAGNVIYSGCQWAILAALAHLGTKALVGQYVLALAISGPILAFCMLQLRSVQATDARGRYGLGDYLALRCLSMGLALAAVLAATVAGGYRGSQGWVILAAGLTAAIDGLSDIVYGALQRCERLDRVAQSMIIKGLFSLGGAAALFAATRNLPLSILWLAAVRGGVLLAWDLPQAARALGTAERGSAVTIDLRPRWDLRRLTALARLALPLGVVMMLLVLNTSIPRYFVERNIDGEALGVFGALGYLSIVGAMMVTALGEAASPRLARYYAEQSSDRFLKLLVWLVVIGVGIAVAGVAVAWIGGSWILTLLYGRDYAQHHALLVWLMVAGGLSNVVSFFGYAITAARYFSVQIPLFALTAATTAVMCWWLVPGLGLIGAAWALAISAGVQLLGAALILTHAWRAMGE